MPDLTKNDLNFKPSSIKPNWAKTDPIFMHDKYEIGSAKGPHQL